MIPEISTLSCEERLFACGILSLEMRRLRSDLVLVLMIIKGFVKVEADKFFQFLDDLRIRGLDLLIIRQTCRVNITKYTFGDRMITD